MIFQKSRFYRREIEVLEGEGTKTKNFKNLLKLNTYTFNYKTNCISSFGLIAEEVDRLGFNELVMYDNDGADNGQPIDEKLYVGGTAVDSLRPDLLEVTSGRITLEIVGLSDFTEFAQATISKYEDGKVDGIADGYFFNPYRNEMQHGVIIFENLEVGSAPEATFYQGVY